MYDTMTHMGRNWDAYMRGLSSLWTQGYFDMAPNK